PDLFDPTLEVKLREWVATAELQSSSRRIVPLANVASVVEALLAGKTPLDVPYWRQRLVEYAKEPGGGGVLQRHALAALAELDDPTVLGELPDLTEAEDLVSRAFFELCARTAP